MTVPFHVAVAMSRATPSYGRLCLGTGSLEAFGSFAKVDDRSRVVRRRLGECPRLVHGCALDVGELRYVPPDVVALWVVPLGLAQRVEHPARPAVGASPGDPLPV